MTTDDIKASQRWLLSPDNCCEDGFYLPSRILSALKGQRHLVLADSVKPPQTLAHELRPDAISGRPLLGQGYESRVMRQPVYMTPLDRVPLDRESPSSGSGSTAM